jgi:hypothetical protein
LAGTLSGTATIAWGWAATALTSGSGADSFVFGLPAPGSHR